MSLDDLGSEVVKIDTSCTDPDYWENLLSDYSDIIPCSDLSKDNVNNIIDYSTEYQIEVNKEEKSIKMYDNSAIVGYIEPRYYTHGNMQFDSHLAKYVNEDLRGKGVGSYLLDKYEKEFGLPETEYSREVSNITLLLKFGYIPTNIFTEYGEEREITPGEIDKIIEMNNEDDYTVKFELQN